MQVINNAMGMALGPGTIRRMYNAEAEGILTLAKAHAEAMEIEGRARMRVEHEQVRQQLNMEVVTECALTHIKDDAKPEEVEEDWITKFFQYARDVSNAEMREMWARVLAGEMNKPGSFSRRVLNILSLIDKKQAEAFNAVCRFRIQGESDSGWIVINNCLEPIYRNAGVTFESLEELDSLALINFSPLSTFLLETLPERTGAHYGRTFFSISSRTGAEAQLYLGSVKLTRVGEEIRKICEAKEVDGFVAYLAQYWGKLGLDLQIISEGAK